MKQEVINQMVENFKYWKNKEDKLKKFLDYAKELPDDIKSKIKSEISYEITICADEQQKISDEYHTFSEDDKILSFEEIYSDLTPEQEDYMIESGLENIRMQGL